MRRVKHILREAIALAFRVAGGPWLVRRLMCASGVTVVVYHDPKPEVFESHLRYLAGRYTFISLDELVDAIRARDWSTIPRNALVVTLDDGHRGNFALLDALKRYRIPATVFACSHVVNTGRHFWFAAGHPRHEQLKKLPHVEMFERLERDVDFRPEREFPDRRALDLDEMQRMWPCVSFGSHTRFHALLVNCDDATCREELAESKSRLEAMLGRPVESFAYTNGDYTDRVARLVARAGYRSARTLDIGWNRLDADPFRLKAMPLEDNASINVLCAQVSGLFGSLHRLLERMRWKANPASAPRGQEGKQAESYTNTSGASGRQPAELSEVEGEAEERSRSAVLHGGNR